MPYRNVGTCGKCGAAGLKNLIKGLCLKCYKHVWYEEHTSPERRKEAHDKTRFARAREKVLERDGYTCVDCGRTNCRLLVHHNDGRGHRDGNPEQNSKANHDLDNLTTLCPSCHRKRHARGVKLWAERYNLGGCKVCGTAEQKHYAHGMCKRCYDLARASHNRGGWSYLYTSCVICGTTERKHHGNGMCKLCHQQVRRQQKKEEPKR